VSITCFTYHCPSYDRNVVEETENKIQLWVRNVSERDQGQKTYMQSGTGPVIATTGRHSPVITVTRLPAGRFWIPFAAEARVFPLSKTPKRIWGPPPYSVWTGGSLSEGKTFRAKTDYSPPSSARLRKNGAVSPPPPPPTAFATYTRRPLPCTSFTHQTIQTPLAYIKQHT
jgi:hypothetical protein